MTSRDHFDDRESCCPLIALPSDVAHGGDGVKTAYQEVLALSLVTLCIGGIVAARSVADQVLAQELRRAAYRQAQTVLKAAPC